MSERAAPSPKSKKSSSPTKTRADRDRTKREATEKKPAIAPDLRILETQVFRGPNYWSYDPCIRLLVDLGSLEHWPSNTIKGFNRALTEVLPGLKDHTCSLGKPGGLLERLKDGTWLGHVTEHVAIELQREAGTPIDRGKTRAAGSPGQYNVIYDYVEEQVGLEAGKLAVRLVNHLVEGRGRVRLPGRPGGPDPPGRDSGRSAPPRRRSSTRP